MLFKVNHNNSLKKSFSYRAFGLNWNSSDLEIPELPQLEDNKDNFDVNISEDNNDSWPTLKKGEYDTSFLKLHTMIFV